MKYYVQSGDIQIVIDKPNFQEAVFHGMKNALMKNGKLLPGKLVYCSEKGFYNVEKPDELDENAVFVSTEKVLEDLGIRECYKIPGVDD